MSDEKSGDTYNVTSHGQTGGITAGKIVYGKPKRNLLGRNIPADVVQRLKGRTIRPLTIEAFNPDGETQEFAKHFWDLATQLGWPVTSLPGTRTTPDLFLGLSVQSTGSDGADPLRVLAEWLEAEGLSPVFVPNAPENKILVGQQG